MKTFLNGRSSLGWHDENLPRTMAVADESDLLPIRRKFRLALFGGMTGQTLGLTAGRIDLPEIVVPREDQAFSVRGKVGLVGQPDTSPAWFGDGRGGDQAEKQQASHGQARPGIRDRRDHEELPRCGKSSGLSKYSVGFILIRPSSKSNLREDARPGLPQAGVDLQASP
jgi:hypothetical protein